MLAMAVPPDVEIQKHLTSLHIDEWIREDVFRFRWWLLLFLIIAAVFLWWKLAGRAKRSEAWLYAVLAAIIFMGLNEYGEELTLWDYPTDIIPIFPPLSSINLIMLPLVYSFAFQRFKTLKTFLPAVLILTGIMCFILEPLMSLARLYQLLKWNYFFNFMIFAPASLLTRAITVKILRLSGREGVQ